MEMDVNGGRRVRSPGVVKGSVWESRMRIDQVKGGIKVFGLEEDDPVPARREQEEKEEEKNGVPLKKIGGSVGKRKTWKSESFEGPILILNAKSEGGDRSPSQVTKPRSEPDEKRNSAELRVRGRLGQNGSAGNFKKTVGSQEKVLSCGSADVGQFKFGPKVLSGHNAVSGDDSDSQSDDGGNDEFFDIKEMNNVSEQKPKPKAFASEEKKLLRQLKPKSISSPLIKVQQPSPLKIHTEDHIDSAKPTKKTTAEHKHLPPRRQSRVQDFFDLLMWRDVPKSAMVLSLGTFIIISCSYVKDPNTSFVCAFSYAGLACISAIFLYRSIIWRGYVDTDDACCEVGEEQLVSLVKLLLPYLNGFIREVKALLSGDPAITLKLALLLFVLVRWESAITIGNIIKCGFYGAFCIPKAWSLYSTKLTPYGNSGVTFLRDAWDLCPHKKAVATAIAIIVLVFSSTFSRIWIVFMLFVAYRYRQQSLLRDGWKDHCNGGAKVKR